MEYNEYAQMEQQERKYWWHIGRRLVIEGVFPDTNLYSRGLEILDVGCGTGINFHLLAKWGRVTGLDDHKIALDYCKNKQVYDELILADATNLHLTTSYDLITAFDVLEHIEDDSTALRSWQSVLKPGGGVYLTVPAYPWLWSGHDISLQHKRRYTAHSLRKVLEENGFTVKFLSPFFFFTFPILALVRLVGRNDKPQTTYLAVPNWIHHLLIFASKIEVAFLKSGGGLPWGSSLVVYATKI